MSEFWIAALWILGGAVVLGIVAFFYYRKNNPKKGKQRGRDNQAGRAVSALRSFARSNDSHIIAPAHLVKGERKANLDAVVVGYFGVLGVKALGYNGEIYGSSGDASWLQVSDDGTRTQFPNPILEASGDVRVLRDALFGSKLKQIPVEVVCVFTAKDAQLALPRNTGHLTMKDFKALLRKDKYREDAGHNLDAVEKALRAALQDAE